ncbi:MAG: hypothetical protein M3P04_05655 [Actinomycetota bacterium]|nr:hypothetical protein [Actinomycetota bacterium]
MTTLTIPPEYTGPPDSANGGVTCGLLSQATGLAEVTLRQPPPLKVEMRVEDGSLFHRDTLVATAAAGLVTVEPPEPVALVEAALATAGYGGWQQHPFPTCFVCGPQHPDGLRIFPGPVRPGVVGAPWIPDDDDPVMVWAALDCPSGWSFDLPGRPMVLGRMTCRIDALPKSGNDHVVLGWRVSEDGRKGYTGSALYTADGKVLAVAQQTWIAVS